jgi:ABC-2 type transport system ATP-binding protein
MHTLSKGNKQKIGLIQAFMHKPDLLILDEPTGGLDPLMKQVFYDMVLEMKDAGKTIFVSSHDLTEVQKICDRAAFIREGTLIDIENIKGKTGTLQLKRFTVTFPKRPLAKDYASIKGVTEVATDDLLLHVKIHGDVAPFITELAKHTPTNLEEQDTTLEDIFMHFYNKETQ